MRKIDAMNYINGLSVIYILLSFKLWNEMNKTTNEQPTEHKRRKRKWKGWKFRQGYWRKEKQNRAKQSKEQIKKKVREKGNQRNNNSNEVLSMFHFIHVPKILHTREIAKYTNEAPPPSFFLVFKHSFGIWYFWPFVGHTFGLHTILL